MAIIYAGDIHGDSDSLGSLEQKAQGVGATAIVQVGDFGAMWPNRSTHYMTKFLDKRASQSRLPPILTCGGNHDNWDHLLGLPVTTPLFEGKVAEIYPGSNVFYVPRGTALAIDGKVHVFFGGAESTDKAQRREGLTWWPQETPTKEEFSALFVACEVLHPEVVVTHDAPYQVPQVRSNYDAISPEGMVPTLDRRNQPTPANLGHVFTHIADKPKVWYYGHFHNMQEDILEGTKFRCCGLEGDCYIQR